MPAPIRIRPSTDSTGTGSPNGLFIEITAVTAGTAQVIDQPESATQFPDDGYSTEPPLSVVTLIAVNTGVADCDLHIQWGGGATTATRMTKTVIAGKGIVIVMDRELIALGSTITAWANLASTINVKMTKWPYTS